MHLQKNEELVFLERTNLPKLTEELLLHDFLAKARWESCDVLILLNTFAAPQADGERLWIVRVISTRTLQTLGLWVYPEKAADASSLAVSLAARLGPLLGEGGVFNEGRVVSVSLLRAETPALNAMAEGATYLLGAQIQNQPGLSVIERWNVWDPGFEQWLRRTEPADIRKPDIFVEGMLVETKGGAGLRLAINGAFVTFEGRGGDASLKDVSAAAARAIGGGGPATAVRGEEAVRFEKDARWFWKWGSFRRAFAAADTAIHLGSVSPETRYIRALAYMRVPRDHGYVSNLQYADTPTEEAFQNSLRGLQCFLENVPPSDAAPSIERWKHVIFSEDVLCRAAQLLQGLYFSEQTLPGTDVERLRFRQLTRELADRTLQYAKKYEKDRSYYATYLEHISNESIRQLPGIVILYGGLMTDEPRQSAAFYAAAFEELARRGGVGGDNGVPSAFFGKERFSNHHPWVSNWENRAIDESACFELARVLMEHSNPEVRIPAYLIPVRYDPENPAVDAKEYDGAWLRRMLPMLKREKEALAANPTKYSFQLLACVGSVMDELRKTTGARFPETEWRQCVATWQEAAPVNSRNEYAGHTERYLRYLMETSLKHPLSPVAGPLPQEQMGAIYRHFMQAPPPLSAETRQERTLAHAERVRAWKARDASSSVASLKPSVVTDGASRPLPRQPPAEDGARQSDVRRWTPELLFAGHSWGSPGGIVVDDAANTVWFSFWNHWENTLTFVATDGKLDTILRVTQVRDWHSESPEGFAVDQGSLYWVAGDRLFKLGADATAPEILALPKFAGARIWFAGGRGWLSGQPGLIYEYDAKERRLKLISSSMRSPAMNVLDARNAYRVSRIFEHQGGVYAWIDEQALYQWNEVASDWREIHWTRKHLRPNQSYPADLLLKAIGRGIRVEAQENSLAVLALDPGFGGLLRPDYRSYPAVIRAPDGQTIYASEMKPAATTENALWVLFQSPASGLSLGGWRRGTGAPMNYPLQFPQREFPNFFQALPDGFVFYGGNRLFYLSRAGITAPR